MWPQVVLFGDSLTQRSFSDGQWGAALADSLQRKCDVISRGFAGYNASWCNAILPELITKEMVGSIAVLTLFFGTNDSVMEGYKQHVPLDDFKAKMKEMLQYLLSIGLANEKIVIITPPRVNETAWEKECKRHLGHPKNKTNEITSKYAEVCCHLGQAFHIDVLDLFNVMLREQNWERFLLSDGIHLSVDGAKLLHQHLLPIVLKKTSHLPTRFPLWRDVDDMHPENSLLQ